jgi:hypothetical protein
MPKGKKLKREDYPFMTDEEFKFAQEINDMDDEGPNIG